MGKNPDYSFNFVDMEIRDFHIWHSCVCIAAQVICVDQ